MIDVEVDLLGTRPKPVTRPTWLALRFSPYSSFQDEAGSGSCRYFITIYPLTSAVLSS